MNAIYFIVHTLLQLALLVVLARLLLQWARADFRNPICQAIVRLTNPVILPLRRVLPPIGKIDTASVVAVIAAAFIEVGITLALRDFPVLTDPALWARAVALELARVLLYAYFYMIFLYALLSFIAPGGYSPMQEVLETLCEPVLRPFRRIPPLAGLDLSPLWAGIVIQALLLLLPEF